MLKNIVLWVCEGMSSELFTPERLVDRLKNALYFFKQCLQNNYMPCYFHPKRDLLIGKMEGKSRVHAEQVVSKLLNSNGLYLLHCERLCKSMILTYNHSEMALSAMFVRNKLEFLVSFIQYKSSGPHIWNQDVMLQTWYKSFTDRECFEACCAVINIIGFDSFIRLFDRRHVGRDMPLFMRMIMM